MPDTIALWRPTGQAELDLVAGSGWRAWPPRLPDQPIFYPLLNPWYATKIAREWNVPAEGVGYMTRFDVDRAFLDRYEVRQAGGRDAGEYRIPAEDLDDLNAHLSGAIVMESEYRGPLSDQDFAGADLPEAWRAYLQGPSWLRRGWLANDTYLELQPPGEMLDAARHPGGAVIGGDGSRERLVLDLRDRTAPVMLVDITSEGWDDAVRQSDDVGQFIERVEAGTFTFSFGDD